MRAYALQTIANEIAQKYAVMWKSDGGIDHVEHVH